MRAAILLAAVAVVAWAGVRLAEHQDCSGAREALYEVTVGGGAVRDLDAVAGSVRSSCRDARELAGAASALQRAGRADLAVPLAREAARRDPEAFEPWTVLAASGAGDEAARATERARALNPLWRAPAPSR